MDTQQIPSPCSSTPSTDVIISHYESLMTKSISAKTLAAAQSGKAPLFTKEEMSYLVKKAVDDSASAEVSVITPTPTITLKKGKTEINIKNAADLVRKMDEKYPIGMSKDQSDYAMKNHFKDVEETIMRREGYNHPPVDDVIKPEPPTAPPKMNSVNKNAYEIRADVLAMALDFIKYRTQLDMNDNGCEALQLTEADGVVNIAKKFYAFVENRQRL